MNANIEAKRIVEAIASSDTTLITALREALEPFAELGRGEVAEQFTDGTVWFLTNGERRLGAISMGALRQCAALSNQPGERG